jgi:hypothetical protein
LTAVPNAFFTVLHILECRQLLRPKGLFGLCSHATFHSVQLLSLSITNFIFVGCMLLRNVHDKNLSDIYLQSQLPVFIGVIISPCITTCFGPNGPSSCEHNISFYFLKDLEKVIAITTDPKILLLNFNACRHWGRRGTRIDYWWESLRVRDH